MVSSQGYFRLLHPTVERTAPSFHTQWARLPDIRVTVKPQKPVILFSEPWQKSKHPVKREIERTTQIPCLKFSKTSAANLVPSA